MLIDSDKQQLVAWLLTQRSAQVKAVSPGVLAHIIEEAGEQNTLHEAKDLANAWINEVANFERQVPLRVLEPEAGLQSDRVLKVPNQQIKGAPLVAHLISSMELLDISKSLVRKLSLAEACVYCDEDRAMDVESVFPAGTEGDKAFRIDKAYGFQSAERNKEAEHYDYHIVIDLTRTLKDYLISNLWVNIYKIPGENFKHNPQTKYEGGGYSIVIPKDGWRRFWQRVESFRITNSNGEEVRIGQLAGDLLQFLAGGGDGPRLGDVRGFAAIQMMRDLAAHQRQLRMFHADEESTRHMGRPSYIS